MDDEPAKVEEGRRRNDVARLRVGQIRFDESDVLKERSDFRWVDGFLLYRQAVETKAERCFEDDIGGDLKHKNCFEVFLNDNNFIFNKTEPGKTEFYWDFNNSFHFNYLFRLIFLTYYLNEGPNFNPFLRPLSGFIFTSNNPFSFVRRLTSFTFANVEFKLIQTSNFNLLRRQIIS